MIKFAFLVGCVGAIYLSCVYSFTPEVQEIIRKGVEPLVTECANIFGISYDEIKAAQVLGTEVKDLNACFLRCILVKTNLVSDQGIYNTNTALDILQQYLSETEFPIYQQKGRNCGYVNNQTYCDGTAGCELAKAVFLCLRIQGVDILIS